MEWIMQILCPSRCQFQRWHSKMTFTVDTWISAQRTLRLRQLTPLGLVRRANAPHKQVEMRELG